MAMTNTLKAARAFEPTLDAPDLAAAAAAAAVEEEITEEEALAGAAVLVGRIAAVANEDEALLGEE